MMLVGDHGLGANAIYRGNDELKDTSIPTNFFLWVAGLQVTTSDITVLALIYIITVILHSGCLSLA
ncbi:hypothetical protein AB6H17_09025 [Proteus vulgaris]|uniref:hypothetical protein n=1 Tax=Proteus vulgaris TaxID=585 RepID=UPI0034DD6498